MPAPPKPRQQRFFARTRKECPDAPDDLNQARQSGGCKCDTPCDPTRLSEQRGGAAPGGQEVRQKGPWAARAGEGVVPSELGGSDAPDELLGEDSELGGAVLGGPARSEGPATEAGVDPQGGEQADATSDGGLGVPPGAEADLKDAARGPRRVDVESAG